MTKVEEAMEGYWGARCPAYDRDCSACKAWDEYDTITVLLNNYRENYKEKDV